MELANKRLNAVNSHFLAERDRCVAELESLLNNQGIALDMELLVKTFERLAVTNVALENIRAIISDNSKTANSETGFQGFDMSQTEEMNRMLEVIKDKLDNFTDQNHSTNQP